jgi:Xaa-Pro aminopeptidase
MRSINKPALIFPVAWLALGIILGSSIQAQGPNVLTQRRARLVSQIPEGILIIQSSERNQNNLHEFFIPNSDNHDFIYFTGLDTPGATLILCPASKTFPEILYIDGDLEQIKQATGIEHVFPAANLLPDLSNAYTDYPQMRYTQLRFKPLPSEIARVLYREGEKKVVYFNYPRFVNLAEPPPERLAFIQRFRDLSPKYEIRDACDPIDRVRMYHDAFAAAQLREAARISGEAMIECMRSVRPGMTQAQLRIIFDFTCQYQGIKSFGFPTSIRSGPNRYDEHFPRRDDVMQAGYLVTIDAGVEVNHYTADIQRTFPVSGTFTPEQRKAYTVLKKAQEACIRLVRPGCTMKALQDKAMEILDQEGDYGRYFYWGTSHFLGMEVHDHGNNLIPFKPGVCITVEPGLVMDEFTIVLEDDVLCTEDGHDWLTEFIPREIADIERVMKEKGSMLH